MLKSCGLKSQRSLKHRGAIRSMWRGGLMVENRRQRSMVLMMLWVSWASHCWSLLFILLRPHYQVFLMRFPCFYWGWNSIYHVVTRGLCTACKQSQQPLSRPNPVGMAVWPRKFFFLSQAAEMWLQLCSALVITLVGDWDTLESFWQLLTEWAGAMRLYKEAASTGNRLMQDHICSYVHEAPVVCFNNLSQSLSMWFDIMPLRASEYLCSNARFSIQ